MRNYKELKIWQKGMQIGKFTYQLANDLPKVENYGLRSQITRCAVSIASNVAEGSSRSSDKDYARFIEIALGSAFELETQLLLLNELNLVSEIKLGQLLNEVTEEQKMLSSFWKTLKA